MTDLLPVFDGHNDILLRMFNAPQNREAIWLSGEGKGHLDLPRMAAGGFAGGMFAIYVPSAPEPGAPDYDALMENPPYAVDLPKPVPLDVAQGVALAEAGHLLWMERASGGRFKLCRTAAEIEAARAAGVIAGVMHMEGAEAIDEGLDALHAFYAMGLRSLGPVWSRPTIFGHGVPFKFPGQPDTGPGLTDAGKRLIRECNALGIVVDLSHLNEAGFWDVARVSDAPLVATHSNAHAVTAATRNLTDKQLRAISETKGVVGVNFGVQFLRLDGVKNPDTAPQDILRHLDHLLAILGEDGVALGSDFDGAMMPQFLQSAAGLPVLVRAMETAGYGKPLIDKICWGNWVGVLERTIG